MGRLSKDEFGRWAERRACRFLKRQGLKVLARNFRVPCGEIDIVAADDGALVFVEVKAERSLASWPELKVTAPKRKRIVLAAKAYVGRYKLHDVSARFDIVVVQAAADGQARVEHQENAFEAQ